MGIDAEVKATQVLSFCGGKAKRFGYSDLPKPLLPLGEGGQTLLDYQIRLFMESGFTDFVFLIGHAREKITAHLKARAPPITGRFAVDPPLPAVGKGKALKHALLNGTIDRGRRAFISFPDDLFTDRGLPLRALTEHLAARARDSSIAASVIVVTGTRYPFGVVTVGPDNRAVRFEEKPMVEMLTNTGLCILEPECYEVVEAMIDMSSPAAVEFESTLLHKLAAEGRLNAVVVPQGVWLPINDPKEYEAALQKVAVV